MTGDHWSLLFQLWRSSLIISNCTTKTIIDRLLYQLHVQRQALILSFISFMLKGDHCSLLLSAMCLMAITDCLCYQFYDWRRSIIAFLSTMWLKAINNYMYGGETLIASFISAMFEGDHWPLLWWMIPYKRAKRSLSTFFSELTWLRTNGYLHSLNINNKTASTHVSGREIQ